MAAPCAAASCRRICAASWFTMRAAFQAPVEEMSSIDDVQPMTEFEDLPDLAAERLGGRVLAANDEFFAEKENLLKAEAAIWIADKYTEQGKWMDGWATRSRRTHGFDWAVERLGLP